VPLSGFDQAPIVLPAMQTFDGNNTTALRLTGRSSDSFTTFVEEEQSSDGETRHITENVGYLALTERSPQVSMDAPDNGVFGDTFTLSAEAHDLDGDAIDGYEWTIDGDSYTDQQVTYTLDPIGDHEIRLEVTDETGQSTVTKTAVSNVAAGAGEGVIGGYFFYNNSAYDHNNPALTPADDTAIATNKQTIKELEQAGFANYSTYEKGITGVMLDVEGLGNSASLDDFEFRSGPGDISPSAWSEGPRPDYFEVREGAGEHGADRVVFGWDAQSAVKDQWLQVTALPTSDTNLFSRHVRYFGSAVGDAGNQSGSTRVAA
jgi:hypothetical protein